jgi:hypothetical protein
MRTADRAWLTFGAGVLAYEILAPTDELLSYGCDRYLQAHPWLTRAFIGVTALHLLNAIPGYLDPYHGFGVAILRMKGRNVTR